MQAGREGEEGGREGERREVEVTVKSKVDDTSMEHVRLKGKVVAVKVRENGVGNRGLK